MFSFEGFRYVSVRYTDDPVSGDGSMVHGGRYNPPPELSISPIRVVYVSESQHTAWTEIKDRGVEDKVLYSIQCSFKEDKYINLSDPSVMQEFKVTLEELTNMTWREENSSGKISVTQELGIHAHDCGVEAMKVPSATDKNGGCNWVIFLDNLDDNSSVKAEKIEKG